MPVTPSPRTRTAPGGIRHTVRELRTSDARPNAPRAGMLFSRESSPPALLVALWDISRSWPGLGLDRLAADARHGSARLDEVRLFRQIDTTPLAVIEHTVVVVPDADAGSAQTVGVVQVHASVADTQATHVALTLLEQADHVLLLAGEAGDEAAIRQLLAFAGQSHWTGPRLRWVLPLGHSQGARRLRGVAWSKGLRIRILETSQPGADCSPWPWLQNLLTRTAQAPAPVTSAAPAPSPPALTVNHPPNTLPENPVTRHKAPRNAAESTNAHPVRANPGHGQGGDGARPAPAICEQALTLVAMAPGVIAAAVIDCRDGSLLAQHGAQNMVQLCASAATQLWAAYDALPGVETLHELEWASGQRHHLLLPLRHHPGLCLLAAVDREFGDLAAARWQLAVARNDFL